MNTRTEAHTLQGIQILDHGAWNWNTSLEDHSCNLDPPLTDFILEFLSDKNQHTIMDFGCATGYFLQYISQRVGGIELIGIEPFASKKPLTHFNNILDYDLAVPFNLNKKGSIFCLEVAEHIPEEYESILIDNIVNHCEKYLFMSWASRGQGGWGHFNEKNIVEVVTLFRNRGFKFLEAETNKARSISITGWLIRNFAIFEKT